jgi:hypothetical protein
MGYPNSKFILTVREMQDWLQSWQQHDAKLRLATKNDLPNWVKSLRRAAFGQWQFEPGVWQQTYEYHVAEVMAYFSSRQQDLLVLKPCAGEGWEQLCPFLSKPLPTSAFPHQNKASDALR